MLRLLVFALVLLVMMTGCSSGGSGADGGADGQARDYAKIEGPTTNPIVDLPVHQPDSGVGDASAAE